MLGEAWSTDFHCLVRSQPIRSPRALRHGNGPDIWNAWFLRGNTRTLTFRHGGLMLAAELPLRLVPCLHQAPAPRCLGGQVGSTMSLGRALSTPMMPHRLTWWVWRHRPATQGNVASAWFTGEGTTLPMTHVSLGAGGQLCICSSALSTGPHTAALHTPRLVLFREYCDDSLI